MESLTFTDPSLSLRKKIIRGIREKMGSKDCILSWTWKHISCELWRLSSSLMEMTHNHAFHHLCSSSPLQTANRYCVVRISQCQTCAMSQQPWGEKTKTDEIVSHGFEYSWKHHCFSMKKASLISFMYLFLHTLPVGVILLIYREWIMLKCNSLNEDRAVVMRPDSEGWQDSTALSGVGWSSRQLQDLIRQNVLNGPFIPLAAELSANSLCGTFTNRKTW